MATRAITVLAPGRKRVWPWIAQIGQGRGGLYSYDFLENLVGCDMHSADHIVAEWQDVKVGDELRLHPEVPLTVVDVEPGRYLVVRGGVPMGDTPPPYEFTWAFVVREQDDGATRLLVRERYDYTRTRAPFLVEPVEAVSFFMSQKMLRGIRDRAERSAPGRPSRASLRLQARERLPAGRQAGCGQRLVLPSGREGDRGRDAKALSSEGGGPMSFISRGFQGRGRSEAPPGDCRRAST